MPESAENQPVPQHVEEEELPQDSHLHGEHYAPESAQTSVHWSLQAAAFLNMTWTVLQVIGRFAGDISKGIYRAIQPDTYIFFSGEAHPYRLSDVCMQGPGVAPIAWNYNARSHTFISGLLFDNAQEYVTHHLPFLACEIKYNDLVLYDISDFVEKIRWAGAPSQEHPSPRLILAAWTLESGVVLQHSDSLKLSAINDSGDIVELPLLR